MDLEAFDVPTDLSNGFTQDGFVQSQRTRNMGIKEPIAGPSGARITTQYKFHKPDLICSETASSTQASNEPYTQKIVSSCSVASRLSTCDCPVAERFYTHQHTHERSSRNQNTSAATKRNRRLVEYRRETQKFRRELRRLWQDMDRLMNAIANYRLRRVPPAG